MIFIITFAAGRFGLGAINKVEVFIADSDSLRFISEEMLCAEIKKKFGYFTGKKSSLVKVDEVESELLKLAYVRDVNVYVGIDRSLNITVLQKRPLARVIEKNASYYIDSLGEQIPVSTAFSVRVPVVYGRLTDENKELVCKLLKHTSKSEWLQKYIVALRVSKDGRCTIYPIDKGYTIQFGKIENIDKKISKLKRFYSTSYNLLEKGIYKTLNIEFDKQIVCTKKQVKL